MLLVADFQKFIKSRSCYGHIDRRTTKGCRKKKVTVRMEGIRKTEKPWNRWTEEAEKDLKITGVKNQNTVVRDRKE